VFTNNKMKHLTCTVALITALSCSTAIHASPNIPVSEDETILIDHQPSKKIPYSKIARALIKEIFQFDSQKIMTFGGSSSNSVARSFADYVDRTKTRFKVKEDEVEVEFKLQF